MAKHIIWLADAIPFLTLRFVLQDAHVVLFKYGEDGEDEETAYTHSFVRAWVGTDCAACTVMTRQGQLWDAVELPSKCGLWVYPNGEVPPGQAPCTRGTL